MTDVVAALEQRIAKDGLPVLLFSDSEAFERWLAAARAVAGAWLMFAKKGSGALSLTRQEAIDAALCEGWIDGQGATWDDRYFLIRFTPRRPRGKWSQINRARADALVGMGRMRPAGAAEMEAAQRDGRWESAYPSSRTAVPPPDLQAALDGDRAAADRFAAMPKARRYAFILALANAQRQTTRDRRIAAFLAGEGE